MPSPSFLVFNSFQSGVPIADLFRCPVRNFYFYHSPFLSRGFGLSGLGGRLGKLMGVRSGLSALPSIAPSNS